MPGVNTYVASQGAEFTGEAVIIGAVIGIVIIAVSMIWIHYS